MFAIRTPTATITDLGTEFGVEVGERGDTVSHVFRGSVRVESLSRVMGEKAGTIVLHESESIRVEKDEQLGHSETTIRRVTVNPRSFVRKLVRPLRVIDLLDIVAGGNGRGHARERGIDPSTGLECTSFVTDSLHRSDHQFHRVPYFTQMDGVFVPDGGQGPTQIDSAGHMFRFPKTMGISVGPIWVRAVEVRPERLKTDINYWPHCGTFGKEFMPERRGLLSLHSNVGITFNLDAIRKAHGGCQLSRFRAMAGKDRLTLADLWVFVDGRLEWKTLQISAISGASRVNVAIKPSDRFLTLVSTDGGDGPIGGDWTVFGDPVLEAVVSEE